MVRWDHQAGHEGVGRGTPPVDQLTGVAAETTAVTETSSRSAVLEQTAVVSLVTVRVNPTGHGHSVGVEEQGRQSDPGICGEITKTGSDRVVGRGKSRERARSRTDDAIESVRGTNLVSPGETACVIVSRRVCGGITNLVQPPEGSRIIRHHAVPIAARRGSGHDRQRRGCACHDVAGTGRVCHHQCIIPGIARHDVANGHCVGQCARDVAPVTDIRAVLPPLVNQRWSTARFGRELRRPPRIKGQRLRLDVKARWQRSRGGGQRDDKHAVACPFGQGSVAQAVAVEVGGDTGGVGRASRIGVGVGSAVCLPKMVNNTLGSDVEPVRGIGVEDHGIGKRESDVAARTHWQEGVAIIREVAGTAIHRG